jgi:hypothetical protein
MKKLMMLGILAVLAGCGRSSCNVAGMIDQFEVLSTADAYGGATPTGAAGPYSVIMGIVRDKLNPRHPDSAGIVDLVNAPVDANGLVSYTTDVVIRCFGSTRPSHGSVCDQCV